MYSVAWKTGVNTGCATSFLSSSSEDMVPKGSKLECLPRRNWLAPVRFLTASMMPSRRFPVMCGVCSWETDDRVELAKPRLDSSLEEKFDEDEEADLSLNLLSSKKRRAHNCSSCGASMETASTRLAQYENWVLDQPERASTVARVRVTSPVGEAAYACLRDLRGL